MKILTICPSTFMDGYDTYSPAATKVLFDSRQVSHIFPGLSPEDDSNTSDEPIQNIGRISLSGAQSKFSVIEKDGEYRLSPAYDLVNTSLQLRDPQIFALKNGLFKEGMNKADTHNIGYEDFVEFGRRIGLNDRVIKQELKMFQEPDPKAIHLIEKSFLCVGDPAVTIVTIG